VQAANAVGYTSGTLLSHDAAKQVLADRAGFTASKKAKKAKM
jgi:hypothetical protein